jgi:uncharacterized protein YhbP (UPF0306 family)
MTENHAALAREIVETNAYMTLATADAEGRPWSSPVWFAPEPGLSLLWLSKPGARHSMNLAARPDIAISIFDSTQAIGTGTGVYFEATAAEVAGDDVEPAMAVFSERSQRQGGAAFEPADAIAPARHRLYRATPESVFILDDRDERIRVEI